MLPRRLVAAYILLVGVPLLALFGILRAGKKSRAPISVAGAWKITADFSSLAGKPCSGPLAGIHNPALKISQSGSRLVLTLDNPQRTTLAGKISGELLTTKTRTDRAVTTDHLDCEKPNVITLNARVDRHTRPESLTGELVLNTCADCAPVPIRATLQIDGARGKQ